MPSNFKHKTSSVVFHWVIGPLVGFTLGIFFMQGHIAAASAAVNDSTQIISDLKDQNARNQSELSTARDTIGYLQRELKEQRDAMALVQQRAALAAAHVAEQCPEMNGTVR